jgi:hypothetical protein
VFVSHSVYSSRRAGCAPRRKKEKISFHIGAKVSASQRGTPITRSRTKLPLSSRRFVSSLSPHSSVAQSTAHSSSPTIPIYTPNVLILYLLSVFVYSRFDPSLIQRPRLFFSPREGIFFVVSPPTELCHSPLRSYNGISHYQPNQP